MITALGLLALFVLSSRNSRNSQECVVRVSVPDEQLLVGRDGLRREEKRGRTINTWISVYFIVATLLRFIITVLLFYCKNLILSFKLVINSETFSEFLFFFFSVQIRLNFSCMCLTFEHPEPPEWRVTLRQLEEPGRRTAPEIRPSFIAQGFILENRWRQHAEASRVSFTWIWRVEWPPPSSASGWPPLQFNDQTNLSEAFKTFVHGQKTHFTLIMM